MVDPGRRICALPLQYIFVTWTRMPGLRKATNPVSMSFCRATKSFCIRYWMALSRSLSVTAKRYLSLVTKFGWASALPANMQSNKNIAVIDILVLILCPYFDCLSYQPPAFGVGCISLLYSYFCSAFTHYLPIWTNTIINSTYLQTSRCFYSTSINEPHISTQRAIMRCIIFKPIFCNYVMFCSYHVIAP